MQVCTPLHTRLQLAFTFGDTHEGFLGLPLIELTTPVAYLSAHTRFIRWVTTLHDPRHILAGGGERECGRLRRHHAASYDWCIKVNKCIHFTSAKSHKQAWLGAPVNEWQKAMHRPFTSSVYKIRDDWITRMQMDPQKSDEHRS